MNSLCRATHIVTNLTDSEALQFLFSKSKQLALGEKYIRLDSLSLCAAEHFGQNIAVS